MVRRPQCGKEKSKTKFTINDIMKIHNSVGVDFGPRVCTHNIGVNNYFGTRITNRHIPKPNSGLVNTKYNIGYYRQSYCCTEEKIQIPKIDW